MDRIWQACDLALPLGERTLLMGVLNVTPDSFSDGGRFLDPETALAHAQGMADDGADILDIGGESTRPYGAEPIDADEELRRIQPVLEALRGTSPAPLSIDTYKSAVARKALEYGVKIVNDIWGFQRDPEMARVVADTGAGAVLMHNRDAVDAAIDITDDVKTFLARSVEIALAAGVPGDCIVLDPGVGFGKTPDQSIEIIARLDELRPFGFPILVGASRKRFIGGLLGIETPAERLNGTLGAHLAAVMNGANVVRAHDIKPHREALDVFDAINKERT